MKYPSKTYKKVTAFGFILSICLILGLLRRGDYFLNKTVRLVATRLIQFERLSSIQNKGWRMEFRKDGYRIFEYNVRLQVWELFAFHNYPDGIVPDLETLDLNFHGGVLSMISAEGSEIKGQSYIILHFTDPKKPSKKRGLLFSGSGAWRVL